MNRPQHSPLVTPPPRKPYRLSNLLRFPRRLLRSPLDPPSSAGVSSASQEKGLGARRLTWLSGRSSLRSQRISLDQLRVSDLYEGTLPPVSLKNLEDYLIYKEHSVENLYFDVWLRSYWALWRSLGHHSQDPDAPPQQLEALRGQLAAAYNLALAAFLHEDSLLELNITAETRTELDSAISSVMFTPAGDGTTRNTGKFLEPAAFEPLGREVSEMLSNSFHIFVRHQRGNGGRKRGYFALAVGALSYLLGWVPLIVAAMLAQGRGWRVFGLPFFFLGVLVLYGGLKNTCLVIYLIGGDSRQLFPWEISLHQPTTLPLGSSATLPRAAVGMQPTHLLQAAPSSQASTRPSTADTTSSQAKSDYTTASATNPDTTPIHTLHRTAGPTSARSLGTATSPLNSSAPALARTISGSPQPVSLLYKLQHFPPPTLMLGPTEPPCFEPYEVRQPPQCESCVFGSLTPVLSPEVKHYQRGVILRGMAWGTLAMILSGAGGLAVPRKG